jgi:hypothetical protein
MNNTNNNINTYDNNINNTNNNDNNTTTNNDNNTNTDNMLLADVLRLLPSQFDQLYSLVSKCLVGRFIYHVNNYTSTHI